jgi:DNA polymerase (family 10)
MDAILNRAKTRGVALELNSQPDRLDLDDIRCRAAKESGILLSIASDSHAPNQFSFLDLGVAQARRGWIEAADVINTRPLATLRKMIRATVAA